jgi:hypothetical protein
MKHFLPVFKALDKEGLRCVTVGGIATVLNGYPRLTGDIDLVLDLSDSQNCKNVLLELQKLGMRPRAPVDILDFSDPAKRNAWREEKGMVVFTLSSPSLPLIEVDLFVNDHIPFKQLWDNSRLISVEDVKIRVASIDDLIALKRLANRPRDQDDIENLLLIQKNTKNG